MIIRKTTDNDGFTFIYDKIERAIITPVEIESALNTKDKITINALWDTGALHSIINQNIINRLDLKCISKTRASSVSAIRKKSSVYMVNLYTPNNTKYRILAIDGILGNFDMLIGMDIISKGLFTIDNLKSGTEFNFRIK